MADTAKSGPATLPQDSLWLALIRIAVLSLPFAGAIFYGVWSYHSTDQTYRDLDASGVKTQARIVSKRIIRSGTDRPRYAYEMTVRFTIGAQVRQSTVPVTSGFFDRHNPPDEVTLRYLPDDPAVGEIDPDMRGSSLQDTLTIVGILLFIGVVNIGMARDAERNKRNREKERSQ
ncbi:DUF3592 domain-containing protein [Pelagibacterium xiamenense]|uniref:DUF3592 domain-containing protein n=1 Tax=Pelagibacterium xiamenense TaxID=2901140 RepID=UPI001E41A730|nr:DUF3592 domain-containing protein [Pelagibacterium xiamenense]MCD7058637.1 DUF3592 domain-containing protein [Pelagibacterium xiamenense]